MANHQMSMWESLNRLNVAVAAALAAFTVFGLIQTKLMGQLVSWLQSEPMIPVVGSLVAVIVLLVSSNTRDPRYYHVAELALVGGVVTFTALYPFIPQLQDLVLNHNPVAGTFVVLMMMIAGAVLGR